MSWNKNLTNGTDDSNTIPIDLNLKKVKDVNESSLTLDSVLMQSLDEGSMLVCVKDIDKMVLKQNGECKNTCGDREGQMCCEGCMEIYDTDGSQQWNDWGNRTYKNCNLHNSYYDVTLICSERHLVTILQPLEERHTMAIEYYQSIGLSKRELEVITGSSNSDICKKLSISNATLRTHLNKVYAKVSEAGGSVIHIPKERSSASGR